MKVNWKYEIGHNVHTEKLDIKILDREIREKIINVKNKPTKENCKYYKYQCNICGYIDWKDERKISTRGCPCCSGKVLIKGINSFADKRPDLLIYFKDEEEAYSYMLGSHHIANLICPICDEERTMEMRMLAKQGFSCRNCGDSVSYPEKFIKSFLEQAKVNYICQLSKKDFNWCDKYRYDFYAKDFNCIIEVNGSQHYDKCFTNKDAYTLEQVKTNDKIKEELALKNGINYYVKIDCRKSNLETIKNGIINSNLCNILNISIEDIDLNKCAIDANKNLMKEVCDFYNQHNDMTPPMIASYFNISRVTIVEYLKRGAELGLCDYNVERAKIESWLKASKVSAKKKSKQVKAYDNNNNFIGAFDNALKAKEYIDERYNVNLCTSSIQAVCTGRYKQHKGFIFKYKENGM